MIFPTTRCNRRQVARDVVATASHARLVAHAVSQYATCASGHQTGGMRKLWNPQSPRPPVHLIGGQFPLFDCYSNNQNGRGGISVGTRPSVNRSHHTRRFLPFKKGGEKGNSRILQSPIRTARCSQALGNKAKTKAQFAGNRRKQGAAFRFETS